MTPDVDPARRTTVGKYPPDPDPRGVTVDGVRIDPAPTVRTYGQTPEQLALLRSRWVTEDQAAKPVYRGSLRTYGK